MNFAWLYVGALVGGFVFTAAACPAVGWLGGRLHVLDRPSGRKAHGSNTPSLGGLAIFLGLAAGSASVGLFGNWRSIERILSDPANLSLLVACGAVFAVGLWDDVRGIRWAAPEARSDVHVKPSRRPPCRLR